MHVGAHVSVAGGVDNAIERQTEVGGNCGQIFTASPQVWAGPDIADDEATRFRDSDLGPWVIHASYLVNLATPKDDLREKSIASLQAECDAAARLGIEFVNVHLGAHTGAGVENGLDNAASAIDDLDVPSGVTLLIESDAGSGTKLGDEFAHLAAVCDRSHTDIGFCLDTAHTFAAGYDLSSPDAVAETVAAFDDTVGLGDLHCLHLNDSKHACGTNKDEHAHVGEGEIGVDGMRAIINDDAFRDLPFVLETPTENGNGFAWNIDRVRELRAASSTSQ
ncbi:deoxyribonuclease IV [Halococcus sediminicola]|uniref:deoxyribonuclease IV n=1 Tax=Halococcus sediminicola TaxID=1264579 RepID=UPI000678A5B3|nr:deoxyribonuclease IV [Halococcus sediminicola]